ncbi:Serine/threonine-protein kinase fray2 [Aduncisulcus paluster]|nr:Serine/threonine-protein kinase fray2 [Aduncisulcus paluster]
MQGSVLNVMKTCFRRGLPETHIAYILREALKGIEYIHKSGNIHRDIKAGNILIDGEGRVLLADFGVSAWMMEFGKRKTSRKTFVGSPCWMAPEIIEQVSCGYNESVDIWSLGITALECAFGAAPNSEYPPMKVMMMTLRKPAPALPATGEYGKYSRVFRDLIDRCLKKEPSERPAASALLEHRFFKMACKREVFAREVVNEYLFEREEERKKKEEKDRQRRERRIAAGLSPNDDKIPSKTPLMPTQGSGKYKCTCGKCDFCKQVESSNNGGWSFGDLKEELERERELDKERESRDSDHSRRREKEISTPVEDRDSRGRTSPIAFGASDEKLRIQRSKSTDDRLSESAKSSKEDRERDIIGRERRTESASTSPDHKEVNIGRFRVIKKKKSKTLSAPSRSSIDTPAVLSLKDDDDRSSPLPSSRSPEPKTIKEPLDLKEAPKTDIGDGSTAGEKESTEKSAITVGTLATSHGEVQGLLETLDSQLSNVRKTIGQLKEKGFDKSETLLVLMNLLDK